MNSITKKNKREYQQHASAAEPPGLVVVPLLDDPQESFIPQFRMRCVKHNDAESKAARWQIGIAG